MKFRLASLSLLTLHLVLPACGSVEEAAPDGAPGAPEVDAAGDAADASAASPDAAATCGGVVCDQNATCDSEVCECAAGFEGDGETCTDIDECASGVAECPSPELCSNIPGSFECAPESFPTDFLPLAVPETQQGTNSLSFDKAGDVIANDNGTGTVFRISRADGAKDLLFDHQVGVPCSLFHRGEDAVFFGDINGKIFRLDASGNEDEIADLDNAVLAMAEVPSSFSPYGGMIIASAIEAGADPGQTDIFIVDPSGTETPQILFKDSAALSAFVFADDGTLYAARNLLPDSLSVETGVIEIAASGATSVVEGGLGESDGIEIDTDQSRLFVADSENDTLWEVPLSGGSPVNLGSYDFDSGGGTSGLLFDGVDQLLLGTGETSLTLRAEQIN